MNNILNAEDKYPVLGEFVDLMQQPIGWMGFVKHANTGDTLHFVILMPPQDDDEGPVLVRPFDDEAPFHSTRHAREQWLEAWKGHPCLDVFNPEWIQDFDRAFWYPPEEITAAYSMTINAELAYEKVLEKDKEKSGKPGPQGLAFLTWVAALAQEEYDKRTGKATSSSESKDKHEYVPQKAQASTDSAS